MFIPSKRTKSLEFAEKENVKDGLDFVLYIIWGKNPLHLFILELTFKT